MMDAEVLASVTADDVESLIGKVVDAEAALMAEVVCLVQEAARRELWRPDGALRLTDWVAQRFSIPIRDARRLCRVAVALEGLAEFHRALADGVLSWAKVVALVDICQHPDAQGFHIAEAQSQTVEHLEAVARRWRKEKRRRAESGDERARNSLRMVPEPDEGRLRFWGHLVGDDAARFQTFIEHAAKNEMRAAPGEEMDPWEVRCGDALAMVSSAALGGLSRDRATLNVHLSEEAAATGGAEGWMSMKPPEEYPVSQALLERLACDARIRAVIEGADGSVLRFSDAYHPPPAMEQAVLRRDVHCRVPGCRGTHGEIHHIIWRSRNGKTIVDNLVLVCWRHHRMIHHDGWRLTGTADALTWARPDGTVVASTGPPPLAA